MTVTTIRPQQLADLHKNGRIELIDVRTPVEFREIHVEFAKNVPLNQLDPAAIIQGQNGSREEPVYLICRSGSRGRQACEKFLAAGFTGVVNVEGGTLACVDCGLPVVRGKKTIALERQVRIAAGALVLLGALLGWFVHPAFMGLSAFVGAGLLLAGVTDVCGMGLMLARMPWNQVEATANPHRAKEEVCAAGVESGPVTPIDNQSIVPKSELQREPASSPEAWGATCNTSKRSPSLFPSKEPTGD